MPEFGDFRIDGLTRLVPEQKCYSLTLDAPALAESAKAGQLVHIKCGGYTLRRPFGVCDAENGKLRVCFEVRGDGTEWLSKRSEGETLSVLGPYGNGFDTDACAGKHVLLIGGGIGVYPLLFTARKISEAGGCVSAALGFRNTGAVHMLFDFEHFCVSVNTATDDGSFGYNGLVTSLAGEMIPRVRPGVIFACGPMPMMKSASALAREHGVECFVSLEERMGCGVGACLACSCDTVSGKKRVCVDGPVFPASEVCGF